MTAPGDQSGRGPGRRRRAARGPDQAVRRGRGRGRHRPRHPLGRVLLHPGPVRVRQDHHPPPGGRLRGAHEWQHPARRRGRGPQAAAPAQREHRLPELRPLPVPVGGRQRRLRTALPEAGQGRVGPTGGCGPGAGPAGGVREAPPGPAVRRPAAAGGPGPGPGPQPVGPPARRAAGRPRRQAAADPAGRAQGPPGDGRDHLPLRDPRPGGGPDHVRPPGRDGGRQGGPGRHPGGGLRGTRRRLCGRLPGGVQPHGRPRRRSRGPAGPAGSGWGSSTWPPSGAAPSAPGR